MRTFSIKKQHLIIIFGISFFIIQYLIINMHSHNNCVNNNDNSHDYLINEYRKQINNLTNQLLNIKNSNDCVPNIDIHSLDDVADDNDDHNNNNNLHSLCEPDDLGYKYVRDYYRYECKNVTRYGSDHQDPLFRIDGAYFVCNDGNLRLIPSNCIVLSFGVNYNDRFDSDIHDLLNCIVHSMDPFSEPVSVNEIRSSQNLRGAVTLKLKEKWFFHSIGITNLERRKNVNSKGWLETYDRILDYLKLKNKVIDVLKIDTEGAEYESIPYIMSTNPDLLCKYVKQIAIETHSWLYNHTHNYLVLQKLEKCFRLYRRDGRFFVLNGGLTEWQSKEFVLPLNGFQDEVDLARFVFVYGELYFININFL